ncbi:Hypothetical protein I595_1322 [Croceitalea dokdonensis DOKDO 023]|uniref:Right handed beta helix domain-containing protein n=1 Tax=Croceitalea dokdonensis DOKDO 023 TaxID=1300341 RepID=A0A0P7AW57_9FLAO|nr:hypothetical protein [Croceitalea dokdonensis]KPM32895.1 Hypothetical protein I595_1322 [Croceitalea dokdonensis DOKDO 023]
MKKIQAVAMVFFCTIGATLAQHTSTNFSNGGRDWYVSKNTGSGQLGTQERPAKDLGNILHHLKPNDRIHVAEGVYMSKGSRGSDEINVPVTIIGGYDTTFSKRDPWGAHKSIFTGTNEYKKLTTPRIYIRTDQQRESNGQKSTGGVIIVDGIIVDNGPRNRYHQDKNLAIRRKASPKTLQNPSPESGGIVIVGSNFTNIAVMNCVVMNTAPSEGAISVRVFQGGKGVVQNNLSINNTGYGIHARTGYVGTDETKLPVFEIKNNTSLFTWKHDAIASYGGDALAFDQNLVATVQNNTLGYGHMGGIYNKGAKLTLINNLFAGNGTYDYKEINDKMAVTDILDEAMHVTPTSDGNQGMLIKIPVAERWAKIYAGRQELSREVVDAAVTVPNTGANQLRSIFGLNLQAGEVAMDAEIFLPLITVEEALPAGQYPWDGKGCTIPKWN